MPLTPKGKADTYNKSATKWTDGKQSWQIIRKKVGILLPKLNWVYTQL